MNKINCHADDIVFRDTTTSRQPRLGSICINKVYKVYKL